MVHPTPRSRLDELLSANPDQLATAVQERTRRTLDKHQHSLVLFGSGHLGGIALKNLQAIGRPPVAFADNNPALAGKELGGVPIMSPKDAFAKFPTSLFVITVYTNVPVAEQLRAMGVAAITFAELAWCYPGAFLPYLGLELPHKIFNDSAAVRATFDLWADDFSREEFLGQLAWRSTLDPAALPPHSAVEETYFPSDLFCFQENEVFVDCGAFDGDSIRAFLQRRGDSFQRATGLEPDPMNRARFEKWHASLPAVEAKKIDLLPYAVGERHETLLFDITGTVASSVGAGKYEVECVPLDEVAVNLHPTFIKMDIEGAEPAALRGAARTMKEDQPILAICLYHEQEHLWRIPQLIHSLNGGYKLYLRRYSDECWEIVCYAVPGNRCKI